MKAQIVSSPIKLERVTYQRPYLECRMIDKKEISAEILSDGLTGVIVEDSQIKAEIITPGFSVEILKNVIFIERETSEQMKILYSFTQGDIVNNRLVRTHNFNQDVVDVTVSDNLGKNVNLSVDYPTSNTVSIDFSRVMNFQGVWKLLIET